MLHRFKSEEKRIEFVERFLTRSQSRKVRNNYSAINKQIQRKSVRRVRSGEQDQFQTETLKKIYSILSASGISPLFIKDYPTFGLFVRSYFIEPLPEDCEDMLSLRSRIRESFWNRLKEDFVFKGVNRGEFGGAGGRDEDTYWQSKDSTYKPAYYLTYWGWRAVNLLREEVPTTWVKLSVENIEVRFKNTIWVRVDLVGYSNPTATSRIRETIRHTIRAVEILTLLDPNHRLITQVAHQILRLSDQLIINGGWIEFRGYQEEGPSIYTSLYAFHFLSYLRDRNEKHGYGLDRTQLDHIDTLLVDLEVYFMHTWRKNKWVHKGVPWEISSAIMIIEIVEATDEPERYYEVAEALINAIDGSGRLIHPYVGEDIGATEYITATRVAYALVVWHQRVGKPLPKNVQHLLDWIRDGYTPEIFLSTCDTAFLAYLDLWE